MLNCLKNSLVFDPEHGVGAIDGQGEAKHDGQVPLVVVDGGGLIRHAGHRPVNDKTGSLGVLCSLLLLKLLGATATLEQRLEGGERLSELRVAQEAEERVPVSSLSHRRGR